MLDAILVQLESGMPAHMVAQVAAQQQVQQVLPGLQANPPNDGNLLVAVPAPLVWTRLESQAHPAGRQLVAASTVIEQVTLSSFQNTLCHLDQSTNSMSVSSF